MRRLVLASLVIAPAVLALGSTSASACGGYGYGYGYGGGCGCAPRAYYGYSSYYQPASYRSYYAPRFAYGGYDRPRVWGYRGWGGRGG